MVWLKIFSQLLPFVEYTPITPKYKLVKAHSMLETNLDTGIEDIRLRVPRGKWRKFSPLKKACFYRRRLFADYRPKPNPVDVSMQHCHTSLLELEPGNITIAITCTSLPRISVQTPWGKFSYRKQPKSVLYIPGCCIPKCHSSTVNHSPTRDLVPSLASNAKLQRWSESLNLKTQQLTDDFLHSTDEGFLLCR